MPSEEEWEKLNICEQMGNIGSEVSRALKARATGNELREQGAFLRACDLIDLTRSVYQKQHNTGILLELGAAKEELGDFFVGDNLYQTTPEKLMKYYDSFVFTNLMRKREDENNSLK